MIENKTYKAIVKINTDRIYIGDPCYCLKNDALYNQLCSGGNGIHEAKDILGNIVALSTNTAYGDGEYKGTISSGETEIVHFGVDSGMLGVVFGNNIEDDSLDRILTGTKILNIPTGVAIIEFIKKNDGLFEINIMDENKHQLYFIEINTIGEEND